MSNYVSPFATSFPAMPPIAGVTLASASSGMRYMRDDVFLACFDEGTTVAGVFTKNTLPGEPIKWGRKILPTGKARALVVNAGYANVWTGQQGYEVVKATADHTAELLGCAPEEIHISSTGVIGEQVDKDKLLNVLPDLIERQSPDAYEAAAKAFITTDTFAKGVSIETDIAGTTVTINGIIKGSGMIAPNMATTLSYVFTDAAIPADVLQAVMDEAIPTTLNCVTVEGDTSTSDTCLFFATGAADNQTVKSIKDEHFQAFRKAAHEALKQLAILLAKDGEGISKFVTVKVIGAESQDAARAIGLSIANSPLVKTAIAAEDPNWGRIVMAVGKTGEKVAEDKIDIWIGDSLIVVNGSPNPDYDEAVAKAHMQMPEITITVDIAVGDAEIAIYSCDLTHEYISINADYRS